MIKIGMLIGDRYEILEKIGTGGMSDVYKAKDHKLNRFVAVKVLKQEFSENTNFVSKFRSEAQAAAGLMHPNIVNVYDVGEEGGIYYIVMELVEGITLKKYIEKKARLSVKEAISIAIQVSMGIEAAHNNHIIHRDIKPQNIIISKDGKVKVTDFGIAKAATSNTITSNVMGSVHYTSPEQARGGYSDEKSDIYSLGVTMFEMLTGRVPFNGETTVVIAIKHIQDPMPSPRDYVPEIPVSVEQIVFKCTQKSPDRRYQKMSDVIEDLKHSLISPDDNFVVIDNGDAIGETKVVVSGEDAKGKKKAVKKEKDDNGLRLNESGKNQGKKSSTSKGKNTEKEDDYDPKMEHVTTVLAVIAAVLIGCIILFIAGKTLGIVDIEEIKARFSTEESRGEEVEMPDVEGMSLTRAKSTLSDLGLDYNVTYEDSSKYEQDIVIESNIKAGRKVALGTIVELTVSAGTEGVSVLDVRGKSLAEATAMLEKEGFQVSRSEVSSDTVEKGYVAGQKPDAGEKAPRGTTVTLQISSGPDSSKISVPNVMGMDEMNATVTLTEAGLVVGNVEEVNYEDPAFTGLVCYQSYSVGEYVDPDTRIDIKISMGPVDLSYGFNASIDSPLLEDPTFVAGTPVTVILTTADGKELLRTNTTSFPVSMNVSGIKGSPTGKVVFQYVASSQPVTTTDPATGETVTTPGTQEQRALERIVTFTPEG